ncbi:mitotic checkpoint regulator, MAD2B-interacting-domain-containing protein [Hypomontagnella submonticulosa]|nr:mitotic checkpoint regulator, MAD2B-interacting-domain-containing protein [Hypomontagnella submonticulosa]
MGLVDYSDSESDSESVPKPIPAPPSQQASSTASGKKTFQKVVDRAKPGKILVNLPQNSAGRDETKTTGGNDGPPAKRARIAGKGGGAFSGFNSFLPPPKNVGKPAAASSSGKSAPRPGINLKTGATPGFSREIDGNGGGGTDDTLTRNEDAEASTKQPSIPAEQKPADEVKLVGKPLMFKPLSVSRKPGKKNITKSAASKASTTAPAALAPQTSQTSQPKEEDAVAAGPPAKKQKRSLFSISDDTTTDEAGIAPSNSNGYEPMFSTEESSAADEFAAYDSQYGATSSTYSSATAPPTATPSTSGPESLDAIASSMNLSAAARRELFGRDGALLSSASARVVNFNTDAEYAENERLRTTGQLQPAYNPLRPVATGGKSSLRQLVTRAQSQRDALEESFAKGHSNRNEAGSRYGWR